MRDPSSFRSPEIPVYGRKRGRNPPAEWRPRWPWAVTTGTPASSQMRWTQRRGHCRSHSLPKRPVNRRSVDFLPLSCACKYGRSRQRSASLRGLGVRDPQDPTLVIHIATTAPDDLHAAHTHQRRHHRGGRAGLPAVGQLHRATRPELPGLLGGGFAHRVPLRSTCAAGLPRGTSTSRGAACSRTSSTRLRSCLSRCSRSVRRRRWSNHANPRPTS